MRPTALAVLLIVATATAASAQKTTMAFSREADSTNMLRQLLGDFTLTPAMRARADTIVGRILVAGDSVDHAVPEARAKMDALRRRLVAELRTVLTTDADRAKFDANAKARMPPAPPGGTPRTIHR